MYSMQNQQPLQPLQQPVQQTVLSAEAKDFETKVKLNDMQLKKDPNNANAHHLKGHFLAKLAKATGNNGYLNQALTHLTCAVDLVPNNSEYLCERAKLNASMGNSEMAVRDFQKLNWLHQKQGGQNILTDVYVKATLEELAKLSNVRQTIQSLREKRQLPYDFLYAFDTLTGVTERLVVKVEDHSRQIEALWSILKLFQERVQRNEEVTDADINKIKAILTQHHRELHGHAQELEAIQDILNLSGIRDKATLKKRFLELQNTDPVAHKYCTTLYWTMLNLFQAYRNLSTGRIAADGGESVGEAVFLDSLKEAASFGNQLMQGIPFIGGVIKFTDTIVDKVLGWIEGRELESKTSIINAIIQKNCPLEDDISIMVGKLSLVMVSQAGKKFLIGQIPPNQTPIATSAFQRARNWITAKWEKKMQEWWPAIKNDVPATQAIQDGGLLMAYILINYQTLLTSQEPIAIQIDNALKTDKLNSLFVQMGLGGVCHNCRGPFKLRDGRKSAECYACALISRGGVKCSNCHIKKCKPCGEQSI